MAITASITVQTRTEIDKEPISQLLETVSLYLHIPFCHTRCHYCDFNTYAGILPLREPYVQALLTEIALAGHSVKLRIDEEISTHGQRQAPPPLALRRRARTI